MATKKVGPAVPPRPSAKSKGSDSSKSYLSNQDTRSGISQERPIVYSSNNVQQIENSNKLTHISKDNKQDPKPKVFKFEPTPHPRFKPPTRLKNTPTHLKKDDQVQSGPDEKLKSKVNTNFRPSQNKKPATTSSDFEVRTSSHAFTNKILGEMEAIMKKSFNNVPTHLLTNRPEPEGKECFDIETSQKSIEEKLTESNQAFGEKLLTELTAIRNNESSEKRSNTDETSPKIPLKNLGNENQDIFSIDTNPNQPKSRIRTSDWIELEDGNAVLMTSCHISLEDSGLEDEEKPDFSDISSGVGDSWDSIKDSEECVKMSLPGLPPLPKSLIAQSQTNINYTNDQQRGIAQSQRQPATLDTQLAILRREMCGLRQLDLSLLSQLWTLNESIQEFRSIIQEQETLSPLSPSPSNSESDLPSSEDEQIVANQQQVATAAMSQTTTSQQQISQKSANRMRIAPPPPPTNRKIHQSRPV